MTTPAEPLQLLLLQDSDATADAILRELERSGFAVSVRRAKSKHALEAALLRPCDVVVCELLAGPLETSTALEIVRRSGSDVPFIVVSRTAGEETAVEIMRKGANDYLLEDKLARLGPAVRRELREGRARAQRNRADLARTPADASFRLIVEASPDLVVVHRHGEVVYANPKTLARLGYASTSALAAKPLSSIVIDRDARASRPAPPPLASVDRPAPIEQWWKAVDGALIAVEVLGGAVIFEGAAATVLIARDLTERNQIAATMIEMDRMATIGTLAAGVGHEINNPLAYVLANLEFVTSEIDTIIGELSPEARARLSERITDLNQALADTNHGAERVRAIVHDLRTFSRGDDEVVTLVDVRQILDSSVRMAAVQIRQRATIVKDYADVPPVLASESRLGQVFLNLIVNASQALPDGLPAANRVELRVRLEEDSVTVTITDTGSGIPSDILPRIFEPFFTTKPVGQGTGLGLGICRRIVTQLHGEIAVTSEPGMGTTFVVRIPRASPRSEGSSRPDSTRPGSPRRPRILCIDAEPEVGLALRRALVAEHDVVVLASAADALACVQAGERIDLLLCDLMMPGMSGMELHTELETIAPDLAKRVVFLTSAADSPAARTFLETVKNRHVAKPLDLPELRRTLAEALAE